MFSREGREKEKEGGREGRGREGGSMGREKEWGFNTNRASKFQYKLCLKICLLHGIFRGILEAMVAVD